jgi:hypothetical protein
MTMTDRPRGRSVRLCSVLALILALPSEARAQIPDTFTNLQVLPKDISRDSLVSVMRGFSFALGQRCDYCHVGGDPMTFEGVRFADDDDPDKVKARYMLRMVRTLNDELLAGLPHRDDPPVRVECVTCHRGLARPETIESIMARYIAEAGVDSAVVRYRRLRESWFGTGAFDFRAQRLMEVARTLAGAGRTAEAARILELNAEYYPRSAPNWLQLSQVRAAMNERDAAIAAAEKALESEPSNVQAQRWLRQLRGGGQPPPR